MATSITAETIVSAAIDLFRERGFNGTAIKQIVEHSNTTTGSVYHFFPKGKDQLAIAVVDQSGPLYQSIIEHILDQAGALPEGVYAVYEEAAAMLAETDYLDPCPIGGIAREVANVKPAVRQAIAAVFDAWICAAQRRILEAGLAAGLAQDIATTMVAAIEGGFILARTQRSPEPLLRVGRSMQLLVADQLRIA